MQRLDTESVGRQPNAKFEHVFVVIREDTALSRKDMLVENCIYITKVFSDENSAKAEVDRLNEINSSKDARYFYLLGRFVNK